MIMNKRIYIQPKMDLMAVSTSAMMEGNPLSGGTFPVLPADPHNSAPKKGPEVF